MDTTLIIRLIEILGTFAFAISGIRHAAAKQFDWFGGYVCGVAVAIGGGTLRDLLLSVTPFWMTDPVYLVCTTAAFAFVVVFHRRMQRLDNAWFVFDTLGLALFNIAGIQKSLELGQPVWTAIILGCVTGAAGGLLRDVLLNNEPVIFQREIYALACIVGGCVYCLLLWLGLSLSAAAIASFLSTCLIRLISVRYKISLPKLSKM